MTQVFLATFGTWPDPGNWDPINGLVECVAQGGGNVSGGSPNPGGGAPVLLQEEDAVAEPRAGAYSQGGAGGGGYAYSTGLNLTFPVSFSAAISGTPPSKECWFGANSATPGNVVAGGGSFFSSATNPTAPGAGGTFYPQGYRGGDGGQGSTTSGSTMGGGGGGGAAGPHGPGGTGGPGGTVGPNIGGTGDGGTVPGVAAGSRVAGNAGTQWDASHGCGSGGGGSGGANQYGGNGGQCGGGTGGSQGSAINTAPPTPANALIVITWTPYVAPPPGGAQATMMA